MERTNTTINKEWEGELEEGTLQAVAAGQISVIGSEVRATATTAGEELRATGRAGGDQAQETLVITSQLVTTLSGGSVV